MHRVISPNAARSKPARNNPPCSTCAKIRAAALAAVNKLLGRK